MLFRVATDTELLFSTDAKSNKGNVGIVVKTSLFLDTNNSNNFFRASSLSFSGMRYQGGEDEAEALKQDLLEKKEYIKQFK